MRAVIAVQRSGDVDSTDAGEPESATDTGQ